MSKKKVFAALIFGSILLAISTVCKKQNTGQNESISHEEMNLQELKETDDILPMDFNLQDQYGKFHSLSKYKGKNVILVFWATWCTDCIEELPDIEKLYLEHKDAGQEDLFIFGINTPNKEPETDISKINAFMKENNYTFSTLMDEDGKIFEAYKIRTYPTTYLIGADGKIKDCVKEIMHYEDMKKSIEKCFDENK